VTYSDAVSDRVASGSWTKDELTGVLEKISSMAQRASRITRTIADHVRGAEPHKSAVHVNDIVRSIIPLVEADTHGSGVRLQYDLTESDPEVLVNRTEIESVVLNLMRNAVDALADIAPGEKHLLIRTEVDDGYVVIGVSDTGTGIDPKAKDRLFEPFFTTKPGGIGMGLAISRTIVEAHGGKFSVDSSTGGGTTFRLRMPKLH
jgi:C4-dicarboxylate-specific signal transduction histidine kinase